MPDNANDFDVRMATGAVLYDKTIFTTGHAATFVGVSKRVFLENIGTFGVSVVGETIDNLSNLSID